jgi:hypothetical protein
MAMHAARQLARDELAAELPELDAARRLLPYAANITPPAGVTVMLRLAGVSPDAPAGPTGRAYGLRVVVLTGATTGTPEAEDELDAGLELVLAAITRTDHLTWAEAERVSYGDALAPAYEITATVHALVSGDTP